jgi:beta-glucanase (GH16 family)
MPEARSQEGRWYRAGVAGLLLVGVVALLASSSPSRLKAPDTADGWQLVFDDDFEGDRLDLDTWTTCYWWDRRGCTNAGTNELQWYRPENVGVSDGTLILTADRADLKASDGSHREFVSGIVTTGRSVDDLSVPPGFTFTYGYVEARAWLPHGRGLWPALWLLPADHESRPEIDIMEVLGHDPETLIVHYHYSTESGRKRDPGKRWDGPDLSADWHVYGLEWSPERLTWFLDGDEVWTFGEAEHISSEPMYLIANLAVGGDYPGPPDDSTMFPAPYRIDWVRVWQQTP